MNELLILPPVTKPWSEPLERCHVPRETIAQSGYRTFRACLRWEFAFSCAFCLLHEADLMLSGVEGWGITGVEHFETRNSRPDLSNVPGNCFYSCSRCNRARGAAASRSNHGSLLNSCDIALAEVFLVAEDELRPIDAENVDARLTIDTYAVNDLSKVRMRRLRRETIERCVAFLEGSRMLQKKLLDRAEAIPDPELIDLAKEVSVLRRLAIADLSKFLAVPADRDLPCGCTPLPSLPEVMARQVIDIGEHLRPAY